MVLTAKEITKIAGTMSTISDRLNVIASAVAGGKFEFQDQVENAYKSCLNAAASCKSAKDYILANAIKTPEHLVEASADSSQLFDKMTSKVLALEVRATVLANIIANTYDVEACGDEPTTSDDETDIESEDMEDDVSELDIEDDEEIESEDTEDESDIEDDEEIESEDTEDETSLDEPVLEAMDFGVPAKTASVSASVKKPTTGSSRSSAVALRKQSVSASSKDYDVGSLFDF